MKSIICSLAFIGLLLTSCSKKNEEAPAPYKLDAENKSFHYDEKHQFTVSQAGVEVNGKTITWTSSDVSVATVDANGLVNGKKIGSITLTATIPGKFNLTSTVTITPYSTLCKEPFFEDGATVAVTKSREFRPLVSETATTLFFGGENAKLRNSAYVFKDGKMTSGALLFTTTNEVIAEAGKFYKERYTYLGTENDVYFYGDDNTLIIGISLDANIGFNAIYLRGNSKTLSLNNQVTQQFNKVKANLLTQKPVL